MAIKGTILRKHQTVFVFDTVIGSAYVIVCSKKMSTYRIDYKPVYVHRLYIIRYMQKFVKMGLVKEVLGHKINDFLCNYMATKTETNEKGPVFFNFLATRKFCQKSTKNCHGKFNYLQRKWKRNLDKPSSTIGENTFHLCFYLCCVF